MSKKTLRNLIISSVVFVVTIGALAYLLFLIQTQGSLLLTQLQTLKAEQEQEESFYTLERIAKESQADREKLVGYFLREESNTIELLTQIESLAPQAGVVLKEFDGLEIKTDKTTGGKWMDITISFSGEEKNVETFMRMLEHLPYLLKVTAIDYSAQSSTLWQAKVTMRFYLLAYDK